MAAYCAFCSNSNSKRNLEEEKKDGSDIAIEKLPRGATDCYMDALNTVDVAKNQPRPSRSHMSERLKVPVSNENPKFATKGVLNCNDADYEDDDQKDTSRDRKQRFATEDAQQNNDPYYDDDDQKDTLRDSKQRLATEDAQQNNDADYDDDDGYTTADEHKTRIPKYVAVGDYDDGSSHALRENLYDDKQENNNFYDAWDVRFGMHWGTCCNAYYYCE